MKCPLLTIALGPLAAKTLQPLPDCIKEKCAWWDDGHPGCSILTIAQELATKRQQEEVEYGT